MDYNKQKEILKQQHDAQQISDEEYKSKMAECDKLLDEQGKQLVDIFGKI